MLPPACDLEAATIAGLQQTMQYGQETSPSRVGQYLARVEAVDRSGPTLRAVLERNPEAAAIGEMKRHGATIVDPGNIPRLGKFDAGKCQVLLHEFKADLNKYLTWLGAASPVHSLKDVIAFDTAHAADDMSYFAQQIMTSAKQEGLLTTATDTARSPGIINWRARSGLTRR